MNERSDLKALLAECCGSPRWIMLAHDAYVASAPVAGLALTADGIARAAEAAWSALDAADWHELFATSASTVPGHGDGPTRDAAALALRLYEQRFGHPFVTAAPVRTADELLMRVRIRLGNERPGEWRVACDEQRRRTRQCLENRFARTTT